MKKLNKFIFTLAVILSTITPSYANKNTITISEAKKLIQPFYNFINRKGNIQNAKASFHKNWELYYNNNKSKGLKKSFEKVTSLNKKILPDAKWEIKEIYLGSSNTIIVRSQALGKQFRGIKVSEEKPFVIMSIDIHHIKDGKISKTNHVENWANARQYKLLMLKKKQGN